MIINGEEEGGRRETGGERKEGEGGEEEENKKGSNSLEDSMTDSDSKSTHVIVHRIIKEEEFSALILICRSLIPNQRQLWIAFHPTQFRQVQSKHSECLQYDKLKSKEDLSGKHIKRHRNITSLLMLFHINVLFVLVSARNDFHFA
ncbi:uncharacterized protein LOC144322336 isoform X1 [Canis aureus]